MPRTAFFILPFFAALAPVLTAAPTPAAAKDFMRASGWQPAPIQIAQNIRVAQRKRRQPRTDGRKIACRPSGCFRIPHGCYPTTEYDF